MPDVIPYRARLVDVRDPQQTQRAVVEIPALSVTRSEWARVAMLAPGKTCSLPEVGDEVLVSAGQRMVVAFERGNRLYPVILGSLDER